MVDDGGLDDDARLELLLHRAPFALEAGAAQGQDDVTLGRLGLEHVHEHHVPDGERGLGLGVATEELAVADDALGLRADVDEDLVLVDPHDRAVDHVPVLEALDVRVLLGEELLHRRRLRPGRAGLGGRSRRGLDDGFGRGLDRRFGDGLGGLGNRRGSGFGRHCLGLRRRYLGRRGFGLDDRGLGLDDRGCLRLNGGL